MNKKTTSFAYPVILTPDLEDGGFVVTCRDLPEAITQGETRADAIENAEGALQAALEYRIRKSLDIPPPSKVRIGEEVAEVPMQTALKAELYLTLRRSKLSKTALANTLGVDHKEARRILDPAHKTKIPTIVVALEKLGVSVKIAFERRPKATVAVHR